MEFKNLKFIIISALAWLFGGISAQAQITTLANNSMNERISFRQLTAPLSGSMDLAINKSMVLEVDVPIGHSLIANPEIADIVPMTDRSLYILGKKEGTTSLTLFDKNQRLLGVFDLNVSFDLKALKQSLYELAPGERLEVRRNGDSLILGGTASSPTVAAMANALAERQAPGRVFNMIESARSEQVLLSVRIAEVKRSVAKDLGLRYNTFFDNLPNASVTHAILNPNIFASGILNYALDQNIDISIDVAIDALEESGALTTLAEPSLVAISGETAYFLAGGEFPVPVASNAQNGGTQITIEFKEFGVKLAYTPTVIGDTINLVVEPEVSVLDRSSGIELNDIVIPGLNVRRTRTTVDLKNGQSFAIAGLLQEDFEDVVSQVPGLGNIPILGALARSSSFKKGETELMIVITANIVKPDDADRIVLPTDSFKRPSEGDLFFMGNLEEQRQSSVGAGYSLQ